MIKLVFCLFGLVVVSSHSSYRDAIPNGYAVFNPCGSSYWEAVGHYDPDHHTTEKNPFALAFAAAGHVWIPDLCRADSDGDGRSNGEELGDPNCVWTVGATPERSSTGHPGICEPIGSGPCASKAFTCGCHGQACVG